MVVTILLLLKVQSSFEINHSNLLFKCHVTNLLPLPSSRGLFQPNQHALRHHHRVLHRGELCHHVSWAEVRVPLGGRPDSEEADQVQCPEVH